MNLYLLNYKGFNLSGYIRVTEVTTKNKLLLESDT